MSTASQKVDKTKSPGSTFIVMTLDMSWRLAIAVLAPIIIGNKLDITLKTNPWFTVVGLLLAVAGAALVIRSMVKKADAAMAASAKGDKRG